MLDVLGVDQPHLQPVRLQQIERRLPVVAGRLHHHPGHPELEQPIDHQLQRPGHRGVLGDLLNSTPTVLTRYAGAAHQRRLTDVQGRDPLDDLFLVLRLFQHHPASSLVVITSGCP